MQSTLQYVIDALSLGSTYALLALGLAMVFSILGLINFAHGELVTVAGYTIYLLQLRGIPFALCAVGGIVASGVAALLMERIAFRPLRGASFVTLIFTSFAISVVIQSLLVSIISPRQRGVSFPDFFDNAVTIGAYTISVLQILTTAVCALALLALHLFLRRTNQGLGMLAASQDFQATRLMGISADRVIAGAFVVSGVLAAIAAIFITARRGTVDPFMGFNPVLKAFIATVIGGLGSLGGAVAGGFLLAGIEVALDATLPPSGQPFRDAFALLIVVAILYARPDGILRARTEGAG